MKKICLLIICFILVVPVVKAEELVPETTTNTQNIEEKTTSDDSEKNEETAKNEKTENDGFLTDGKSAILIEASTGKVIYEKNAHERYAPASMTKIMSMILVMEEIDKGTLKWDDVLVTSEYASSMGGSQIFLQPNEKMAVRDLFKAVAVGSANDATVVLAERVAGTEEKFVKKMNEKAKALGLKDTNFKNAVGLDEANHYSSAYDMAMMAKELVKHEEIFKFTTIYEDYLRQNTDNKFWLVNTNKLIKTYEGADGLKTGYTKEAGYCLTATAKKDRMRLIATIMGASDSKKRNSQMATLLDYGYNTYEMQVEVKEGDVVSKKNISKAENETIEIVPTKDASVLTQRGEEKAALNYEIKLNKIKLPIKKGEVVGELRLKNGNKVVSKVPLTVKRDAQKASILELYKRSIKSILSGSI
ncbi:MAG: D-alanyl-D-alanine carboxypeptidase family protein [Bacilli bacterium]|nr:D-alanyl-D-alanine carboxypeptidase family protein [Bacilli bacterium]